MATDKNSQVSKEVILKDPYSSSQPPAKKKLEDNAYLHQIPNATGHLKNKN